jgi:hypothetical protein
MNYTPFFVFGFPKSGTTWVRLLLDSHPEISCKGEACMPFFGAGLSKIINDYNSFLAERSSIGEYNHFPPLNKEDFICIFRAFVERRLTLIIDPGKPQLRFVGEKDPGHAFHMQLLAHIFPKAKFINVLRDGRDVAVSTWEHNKRGIAGKEPATGQAGAYYMEKTFDKFMTKFAREWLEKTMRVRQEGYQLGAVRYHEVRYEDLLNDPVKHVHAMITFLGANAASELVEQCIENSTFEKLSQGRQSGQEDKKSFFRKGVSGDWRTVMTNKQVFEFNKVAGSLLGELGYALD